jgi:hypothetical protein
MHVVHVQARKADGNKDTERFITARGTQQMWRIGWSFYAGAVSVLRLGLIGQAASPHCLSLGSFKACLPQASVHSAHVIGRTAKFLRTLALVRPA